MYDTIIVGSGPAGLTAAIYAARREMKTLVIGKELGGQVIWASEIENYPGFKNIKNFDLINKIEEQVKDLGVSIIADKVNKITKNNDLFTLECAGNVYGAKTVILALGLTPRILNIPGEKEFSGRGVSFCANCDGPFFKNKIVTVIGGGNAALDAAEIMSKIASKVYLVHRFDYFEGFEILLNKVKSRSNIEIVLNSQAIQLSGNTKLEKITIKNLVSDETRELETNGLFIEVGRIADTGLVADLVKCDEAKQIIIDDKCQTSMAGLFAAGDVTNVPYKQITIACGQGTVAALAAYKYLQGK